MKILLVHPRMEENFFAEAKLPPLGLAYVACSLEKSWDTRDVRILDVNVSKNPESDIKGVLSAVFA